MSKKTIRSSKPTVHEGEFLVYVTDEKKFEQYVSPLIEEGANVTSDLKEYIFRLGPVKETVNCGTVNIVTNETYKEMDGDATVIIPFNHPKKEKMMKGSRCLIRINNHDSDTKLSKKNKQDTFLGFIKTIQTKQNTMEIQVASYKSLLERQTKLAFKEKKLSTIVRELLRMANFKIEMDWTGMWDPVITWTSWSGGDDASADAREGDDCLDTNIMAAKRGAYYGNSGDGDNFDEQSKKGYAHENDGYYKYARKFTKVEDLLLDLRKRFKYRGYWSNKHKCASETWNGGNIRSNCFDAARLVKCCCDAAGFPCVVITGSIYAGGHGWNAVKIDGYWKTFDLCYRNRGSSPKGTNSSNIGLY